MLAEFCQSDLWFCANLHQKALVLVYWLSSCSSPDWAESPQDEKEQLWHNSRVSEGLDSPSVPLDLLEERREI